MGPLEKGHPGLLPVGDSLRLLASFHATPAGTWVALVSGFGGLRDADGTVSFAPQPPGLTGLAFSLMIQARGLRVEVTHAEARYALADGGPLEIVHYGLTAGKPQARPIPAAPSGHGPASRRFYGDVLGLAIYRELGLRTIPDAVFFLGPGLPGSPGTRPALPGTR